MSDFPDQWHADLDGFFNTLDRENQAYTDNLARQGKFYVEVVRPALNAAAAALRRHGRTCETGSDQDREYLIIRQMTGQVEFQYAIVGEVYIETVTPYVHCWFEENKLAKQLEKAHGQPEDNPDDAQAKDQGQDKDKEKSGDDDEKGDDSGGESADANQDDDKEPTRTKTMEVLGTWNEDRAIGSVTQQEILQDFVQHYQEAIGLARVQLHK